MKIIRARIKNGKLTDPKDRRNLDAEIVKDAESQSVIVLVFEQGIGGREAENYTREAFGLPTVAE